jgi:hypothetical protein
MTMPPPFPSCIVAIVLLGVLGLPIGHSMIAGSILYLLLSGLDPPLPNRSSMGCSILTSCSLFPCSSWLPT